MKRSSYGVYRVLSTGTAQHQHIMNKCIWESWLLVILDSFGCSIMDTRKVYFLSSFVVNCHKL